MRKRLLIVFPAFFGLGSCSYVYDVVAEMIDGELTFTSDRSWFRERCVRAIDVVAMDRDDATAAEAGDDQSLVGFGTYWSESMDYDCGDRFPVVYGAHLSGEPLPDESSGVRVAPKKLKAEVIYRVSTVSGATGYGGGRFVINADGTVDNLPSE